MLQWSNILGLLAVAALVLYWWHALGIRQRALSACRSYCRSRELQLLDDTVSMRRLWFKRDERGRWHGWRLFVFEFTSTGAERYSGRLVMLGERIEQIQLDPYQIH